MHIIKLNDETVKSFTISFAKYSKMIRFSFIFLILINKLVYCQFNPNFNVLVWSDEANGSGAIDTSKWFHQTLLPNGSSWFNGEQQHYTDRIANSYQNNGSLTIIARKENLKILDMVILKYIIKKIGAQQSPNLI